MNGPAAARKPRIALLSLQSNTVLHFLDDHEMSVVSGQLRAEGVPNDLILVLLDPAGGDGPAGVQAERKLIETLQAYDIIVYERVWNPAIVERIRAGTPGALFVHCHGEKVLQNAPADWLCYFDTAVDLLSYLYGLRPDPPRDVKVKKDGAFVEPQRKAASGPGWFWQKLFRKQRQGPPPKVARTVRPRTANLRPIVINPEAFPKTRTYSVVGNGGCPYQADARENPLFAGVEMPANIGRGCAFCNTGNRYVGKPSAETAASVLDQIRQVREQAPELNPIILKDQNPFGYLTEVVEAIAREGIPPFTMLLETRVDWFVLNSKRFAVALESAKQSGMILAPFLVGIENFAQAELDRMNKGIKAEENLRFLELLRDWHLRYAPALSLDHMSFGFILYSPWTTMADLRTNYLCLKRSPFMFRGEVLLSRTRLYPNTAQYYLARRDGLFAEDYQSVGENTSRRYGYYPPQPWRFKHADVAHFSAVAVEAQQRNRYVAELSTFHHLLEAFIEAGSDYLKVTADDVLARQKADPSPDPARLPPLPPIFSTSETNEEVPPPVVPQVVPLNVAKRIG